MTLTDELARLTVGKEKHPIREPAIGAAKMLLLDALGCAIAGWNAGGCREIITLMHDWGGKPEASILLYGGSLPAPNAAFANSVLIHAQDFDDVYIPGLLHISSIVVPAVLAVGQARRTTGREALEAMVMGVEVAARIGMEENGFRRGNTFLPSSLVGGFGGVAAAARLMGMNPDQCRHALGINYAQVSGNRQALIDSTLTKRMQPALAVRSALWSAALASRGLTGPHQPLEGEAGYYRAYTDLPEPPAPGSFLRVTEEMQIERISYKHYPSCGISHPCQLAVETLLAEEDFHPSKVTRVEIFGVPPGGLVSRPFEIGPDPQVDAQFSIAWAVAHTLLRGRATLADYQGERVIADREVIQLARLITYIPTPERLPDDGLAADVPRHGVVLTLDDGRRLMRFRSPSEVMRPGNRSPDELTAKFYECLSYSGIASRSQGEEIVGEIMQLDTAESLEGLLASLPHIPSERSSRAQN
ncbi:MAG TPA: MmgE/PrpD family protein [Chthoniobacteraceae bacterium]|nr:MmgE/PrpD family protein [Chthoniobacteraceae bacterium]